MHLQAGTHRMHEHILCTFLGALGLADRERGFEKVWGSQERNAGEVGQGPPS